MKHFNSYDDDFGFQPNNDINEYQIKFESMLEKNEFSFMDADQLEDLYQFYWIDSKKELCDELLDFAMEIHPFNPIFYEYKFNQLIYSEKYQEALNWIEHTIDYFPHNFSILKLKGDVLRKLYQYEHAIEWYNSIIDLTQDKSEIYYALGMCYYALNNHKNFIDYFFMAFQENNEDIQFSIFNHTISTFEPSISIELLNHFIDYDPFHSEAWYYLCLVYFYNGDFSNALKAIDYAIAINDKNIDYYTQKVEILISNQQFEEAINVLKEAFTLDEENENILFYLGVCYQNLELFDEARKYFKQCIDIDDSYFDAYEGLADCLYELERYHEALHYYKVYLDNTVNLEVSLKYIDLEIELENFNYALIYMQELENLVYDEFLETELLLRKTYIEYLRENASISHILRENFYRECKESENSSKLMFQAAALSFAMGSRNIGFFYLENALLKFPENYEYLYDYNPDLSEDTEIQLIIESYKKSK